MGPAYHYYSSVLGSTTLAVLPTALTESTISYGSQARNAQLAYDASLPTGVPRAPLSVPWNPFSVGFIPHVMRNSCAMSGIRVLSEPSQRLISMVPGIRDAPDAVVTFAADFTASILSAAVSMPFNQCFNYLAVSPNAGLGDIGGFLRNQYFDDGRLSRRIIRDVFMRCAYIAPQLTTFVLIERTALGLASGGVR